MRTPQAYEPDRSIVGKARRRLVRLYRRRPATGAQPRPRLSITFDDAPASATTTGAAILEARGIRGTYFIASGLLGAEGPMGPYADWADVQRLHSNGHEIACHTFSHRDLGSSSGRIAEREADDNQAAFTAHGIPSPQTFAYPYGDVAPGPKHALKSRFGLLRALHPGLIAPGSDLNQAPSVELGHRDLRNWLRRAAARNAWLIVTTHDVSTTPSQWGCTVQALEALLDQAAALGFEIVTVAEGARSAA